MLRIAMFPLLVLALFTLAHAAGPTTAPSTRPAARPVAPNIALQKTIPEFIVDQMPFEKCMDQVRDVLATNISVKWAALEKAGISKDAPITANLRNVRADKLLRTILQEVATPQTQLDYAVQGQTIVISTKADLRPQKTPAAPRTRRRGR